MSSEHDRLSRPNKLPPSVKLIGGTAVDAKVTYAQILEREKHIADLVLNAGKDALTGLLNKPAFWKEADKLIASGKTVGLFIMDIDLFKPYNDNLGHDAGDLLLRDLSSRLSSGFTRHGDKLTHETLHRSLKERQLDGRVARLGGDEFGLLIELTAGQETEKNRAQSPDAQMDNATQYLQALLNGFMAANDNAVGVTVGSAIHLPGQASNASELFRNTDLLFRNADLAMYKNKPEGSR